MIEPYGHVLFVCTANTCRSPMAAALFRHALSGTEESLRAVPVLSAGVSAMAGYPAAANAVQALKKVGISLQDHRSQPLTQALLDDALAVFCMTEGHRTLIEIEAEPVPAHLYLMRGFMPENDREIPDPFGSNLAAYESSRDSMVEAIPSLLNFVRTLVLARQG